MQKIILITGCSSGFGLLTATRLASKGHIVYATMRNMAKQDDLLREANEQKIHVHIRELDVTKHKTIKLVIDEIITKHSRIDVLVNNAGYGVGGFFEDLTEEEIRQQMEVNFFGVLNVTRFVIPHMRQCNKGTIINVSSVAGLTATPSLSAYCSSKWALEGFSESLYFELINFGIHVVLVEPGSYPTKIFTDNASYATNFNNPQSPYFNFSQKIRRFVTRNASLSKKNPEHVARLIERIVHTKNPRLRYISDFSSKLRVILGRFISPTIYHFIFRKVLYEKK